jgi:hypothetical protein
MAVSTGNEATVQVAIASKNGLDKLKRVVKSLTKNGHVHTLLFHWFGNYTLQDLVVASSKLRRSAEHMLLKPGQSEAQVAALQDLIAGRNDLLGMSCAGHCRPALYRSSLLSVYSLMCSFAHLFKSFMKHMSPLRVKRVES